jgi:NAD(P)-dependent dehydrogenase (short-subunit alcohol dehydrogenase family)
MQEWVGGMIVNSIYPISCLRAAWPQRKAGATVIFMGGPNMLRPSPTYSAYRAGKAMLEALADTIQAEYPEHRFQVLHPGVVNTKIHQQTLKAGHKAANYERVLKIVNGAEKTVTHDEVYQRLKGLL